MLLTFTSEDFHNLMTGQVWLEHIRGLMEHPRDLGWPFLYNLYNYFVQILNEHILQSELSDVYLPSLQIDEHSSIIREVRNLLATYFGVVLIFLRPSM